MEEKERENALRYIEHYLKGVNETIEKYYKEKTEELERLGFLDLYLFLYKKVFGKDFSAKILITDFNFYLFFVKPEDKAIAEFINLERNAKYGKDWTSKVPDEVKLEEVKKLFNITDADIVSKYIGIGGVNSYLLSPEGAIMRDAEHHGIDLATQFGVSLKELYPRLVQLDEQTQQLLDFKKRYENLKRKSEKGKLVEREAQKIGHEFERLWRELLEHYGWFPKKMQLSGEQNDFTAIYNGNHILGEVRWYKDALNGDKIRAFAAKLVPRPATLGLIISYSGFDMGAYSVARRSVGEMTIVFFDKGKIEEVIVKLSDPGEIFSRELRNVYDFLFEKAS